MLAHPTPHPTPAFSGNYILLRADTLRLLLPQHEVGAAEYLEAVPGPGETPGLLRHRDAPGERQFAALSAQMTLLPLCPADRFVVTALGEHGNDLAWCWNDVQVLIDVQLQPRPIPAALLAPNTPVDQYVEHAGEIAFLCSARRLREFALAPGT
ncbi:MAG TPA: hypothetical protein VLJ57_09565 [Burkholderiaceae bacterium]|nr:hypothetical protein [Burkholderiaceae bacterium]